jgi:hypothetical protein
VEEVREIIQYQWRTVADHRQLMDYFSENNKSRRSLSGLSGPQVYRFMFSDGHNKPKSSYIGQSNDFTRRCGEYRRRDKPTERYLRGHILSSKSLNYTVQLQFLDFDQLDLSGVLVVRELLGNSHVRKMLESWAVLGDGRSGIHILNSTDDLNAKAPGHPDDFVGKKKRSRASFCKEVDKLDRMHSLGG